MTLVMVHTQSTLLSSPIWYYKQQKLGGRPGNEGNFLVSILSDQSLKSFCTPTEGKQAHLLAVFIAFN